MRKSLIVLGILVLALSACAPPQGVEGVDAQAQIQTAVALTVAAQNDIGTSVALTVAAQNPAATATGTFTATPLAPPTVTPIIPTITPLPATAVSGGSGGGGGVPSRADYSCDVIHARPFDNTEMSPGADFDIKWTILNTGTRTWYNGFDVKYVSGPNMTATGITRIELPEMAPKAQYNIVFDAQAPLERGFHVMTWKVDTANCYPYVAIIVK